MCTLVYTVLYTVLYRYVTSTVLYCMVQLVATNRMGNNAYFSPCQLFVGDIGTLCWTFSSISQKYLKEDGDIATKMREIDEKYVSAEAMEESGRLGYEFYRSKVVFVWSVNRDMCRYSHGTWRCLALEIRDKIQASTRVVPTSWIISLPLLYQHSLFHCVVPFITSWADQLALHHVLWRLWWISRSWHFDVYAAVTEALCATLLCTTANVSRQTGNMRSIDITPII